MALPFAYLVTISIHPVPKMSADFLLEANLPSVIGSV
uniref:Uncharacterized protein n=1 Tax=Rhizophora mucronata TaxID=61149 RepID=A0A2P2IIY4_RHIMU